MLDDLIVYYLDDDHFRLVVNAGTRDKDLAWIGAHAPSLGVRLLERRDLAMLAVQGPQARERSAALLTRGGRPQRRWRCSRSSARRSGEWFVARTGYTGEDGFEIMLPARRGGERLAAPECRRRALLRARGARHAAAGGGHEPVRQ